MGKRQIPRLGNLIHIFDVQPDLKSKRRFGLYIDGLAQDYGNSSALEMVLSQSCDKPSINPQMKYI